jgi:hypothetical protein
MTALEDGGRHGVAREQDDAIRAVVVRLSRPHASGGDVIERAAILAEGSRSAAILDWITDHDGRAEVAAPAAPAKGLHGTRFSSGGSGGARGPARYVLPAGAFTP